MKQVPRLTPQAAETYQREYGGLPKGSPTVTETREQKAIREANERMRLTKRAEDEEKEKQGKLTDADKKLAELEKELEAQGYRRVYDPSSGRYVLAPPPEAKAEPKPDRWGQYEFPESTYESPDFDPDKPGIQAGRWNRKTGEWESPIGWVSPTERRQTSIQERQIAADEAATANMIAYYMERDRMQQAESERQYKSQLAANPISWLQYAAYTKQPPVAQQWTVDLSGMNLGQQLPGWTPESGKGMMELLRPSAQYRARMGPDAYSQYLGYERARTGATPEQTQHKLRQTAPPGGGSRALRWIR